MHPHITIFTLTTSSFNLMLSISALACVLVFCFSKIQFSINITVFTKSIIPAIIGAIVGGKLLSLITLIPYFIDNQIRFIEVIYHLGFVFYGGLGGMFAGLLIHSRHTGISLLSYSDTYCRLLPLGQAFGRVGCFLNGCCYGRDFNGFLSVVYPVNGVVKQVFPVQLLESILCLLLAMFLLSKKSRHKGHHTFLYLSLYAVLRFILEFARGDLIRGAWLSFSTSQWISILILFSLIGVILLGKFQVPD